MSHYSFLFRERSLDQADEKQLQRIRQISKLLRIDFLPWNRKTKLCNRQFEERSNNNESERAPDRTTTESVDGVEDLAENRPPVVQKTPMTSSKKRRSGFLFIAVRSKQTKFLRSPSRGLHGEISCSVHI